MSVISALNDPTVFSTGTTMVPGTRYVANNPSARSVFFLPTNPIVGQWVEIIGYQAGGWRLDTNSSQHVVMGDYAFGDGGHYDSVFAAESIFARCVSKAPDLFIATSGRGQTLMSYNKDVGGRLSVSGTNAVPTNDVTQAPDLFWTPYGSNIVSLPYEGSFSLDTWVQYRVTAPIQYPVSQLDVGFIYDIFLYANSGTVTIALEPWANENTRLVSLQKLDGIYVHPTNPWRYVGTVQLVPDENEQASINFNRADRGIWNYYNRVPYTLIKQNPATSWVNDSDTTYQEAGGDGKAKFLVGIIEDAVSASVVGGARNLTGTSHVSNAIGLNSTSVASSIQMTTTITSAMGLVPLRSETTLVPLQVGANYLCWLDRSDTSSGSTTFYGVDDAIQCGLCGVVRC